jgi:hypothetical protein
MSVRSRDAHQADPARGERFLYPHGGVVFVVVGLQLELAKALRAVEGLYFCPRPRAPPGAVGGGMLARDGFRRRQQLASDPVPLTIGVDGDGVEARERRTAIEQHDGVVS